MKQALTHWVLWAVGSFVVAIVLICGIAWLIDFIQANR